VLEEMQEKHYDDIIVLLLIKDILKHIHLVVVMKLVLVLLEIKKKQTVNLQNFSYAQIFTWFMLRKW